MRYVNQKITEYISTNLQDPYADWSSVTTYSIGDIRKYNDYHYKSMVDSNLNIVPSDDTGKWLLWEVSNKFASLDLQANTETICDTDTIVSGSVYDLELETNVDGYDYIVLGAMKGTQLTIVEKDVSTATLDTTIKTITNDEMSYAHILDASAYTVEVTITQLTGGSYSSIGSLISGNSISLGDTLYNPKFGFSSDIVQTIDPSGIIDIETSDIEELIDINVIFDSSDTMRIKKDLKSIKGIPTAFILDETTDSIYENVVVIGIVDDFTIVLSNPTKTYGTVSIQEVL